MDTNVKYFSIEKKLKQHLPSLLPFCEDIGKFKHELIAKGNGLYTEKGSPADRLYIIEYYELYKDKMPEASHEEMKAYKALYIDK